MASFYRRPLPSPPATAFSSEQGRRRFREALADGTADGAFRLLEQFRTQDEPAYCGLATLVMVLNALEVDPQLPPYARALPVAAGGTRSISDHMRIKFGSGVRQMWIR